MGIRVKVYGFIAVTILVAVGGYFLNRELNTGSSISEANSTSSPGTKETADESVPVELAPATEGPISLYVTSTANLRALREVDVAARSDGIVEQVFVEEGDYVKAGQALCHLDDTQLRIRLQSAEQRLAQAKLQLEKARIRQDKTTTDIRNNNEDLARLEKLFEDRLVSEREVAQLRYKIEALEHDERVTSSDTRELGHRVEELMAEIEQVKLEISRNRIKAPFSGYIIERMIDLGQTVRNLEPLFKLGDFSPLYAEVYVSEKEARQVDPGQPATVSLGVDESIKVPGQVARVSPVVDQSTGTVKITVRLNPTGRGFKPGAFVRVGIRTDTHTNAVLIPKRAVMEEEGERFVFVADGETAKRAKVKVGYEADGRVEIRHGVSAGEQVVVAGQGALKDGSKLKIVQSRRQKSYNMRVAFR